MWEERPKSTDSEATSLGAFLSASERPGLPNDSSERARTTSHRQCSIDPRLLIRDLPSESAARSCQSLHTLLLQQQEPAAYAFDVILHIPSEATGITPQTQAAAAAADSADSFTAAFVDVASPLTVQQLIDYVWAFPASLCWPKSKMGKREPLEKYQQRILTEREFGNVHALQDRGRQLDT